MLSLKGKKKTSRKRYKSLKNCLTKQETEEKLEKKKRENPKMRKS